MASGCLDFETLESASAGGRLAATHQEHIGRCERCQRALQDLRDLTPLLGELSRASERGESAGATLWPRIAARIERPGLADRLPLPVAAAGRIFAEALRPAAVATAAAGIAGLLLGGWLAVASRSPVRASDDDPYTVSSLVDDSGGGLTSTYLESDRDAAAQDGAELPANPGATGKSPATTQPPTGAQPEPGTQPAPGTQREPGIEPAPRTQPAPVGDSTRAGGRT
jgi:hypothetical protein